LLLIHHLRLNQTCFWSETSLRLDYKAGRLFDACLALSSLYEIFRNHYLLLDFWVDCALTLMRNRRVVLDGQLCILLKITSLSMFTSFGLSELFGAALLPRMDLFGVSFLLARDQIKIVDNICNVRNWLSRSYRICRVLLYLLAIFTATLVLHS
jgi:hypothetical protein